MKGIQCCGDCAGYDRKNKKCGYAPIESVIEEHFYKDCPLPNVAEVKYGEYFTDEDGTVYCSNCQASALYENNSQKQVMSYHCHWCGARMSNNKEKESE